MKLLVCLCSVICTYAKTANITTSFLGFPEETVVPVVLNSTQGNKLLSYKSLLNPEFPLALNIQIARYVLQLSLNDMLIPPNFTSIYFDNNGNPVEKKGFVNCYYQGKVKPFEYEGTTFQNWNAGVSICDGIEGQFGNIEDGYIVIKPNGTGGSEIEQDHLLTYEPPSLEPNLNETVMKQDYIIRQSRNMSGHTIAYQKRQDLPSGFYIIEVVLVNDHKLYMGLGGDVNKVVAHSIQLINLVDMLYFSIGINVVLVMVITWSNGNQIMFPASNRIDHSLLEFTKYLKKPPQLHFDLALLISGKVFKDNSLGVAYVPGVCDGPDFEGIVIGSGLRSVDRVSITTAHEMGHTLGMNHDDEEKKTKDCVCDDPTGFCIMEATLFNGVGLYSQWSSCSVESFERPVATLDCMLNNPMMVRTDPKCGNGVVEGDEECDCNSPENCAEFSACCDMATCKFHNSSKLCRPAKSSCDMNDYCTGKSGSCPNGFIADGQPCSQDGDQLSFCLKALCVSFNDQCKLIYGPSSVRGVSQCFDRNRQGNKQGHCGLGFSGNYNPCSDDNDRLCGLLHCEGGLYLQQMPPTIEINNYFVTDTFGDRKSCQSVTDSGRFPDDSVLVSKGTPCGAFQICSQEIQGPVCVLAFSLQAPCSPNSEGLICSGFGRCTDSGRCICYGDHFGDRCEQLNECLTNQNNCEQTCSDQLAGFTCSCRDGYLLDSNGRTCSDINECRSFNGMCELSCINLPGSHLCRCQQGYYQRIQDRECRELIDECAVNNGGCEHLCIDTLTSFRCSCPVGFQVADDGFSCEDIDECKNTSIECVRCTNTVGSFTCSCNEGFEFNGQRCQEINYCSRTEHTCHSCLSAFFSIMCVCRKGYIVGSDDASCQDINECDSNNGGCSSLCLNNAGSFECGCETGYQLTRNKNCEDIDECTLGTHACEHECINKDGGFQCYCNPGFMLQADGVSCSECASELGLKCEQTCDSFGSCSCYENFVLSEDGATCKSGASFSSLKIILIRVLQATLVSITINCKIIVV